MGKVQTLAEKNAARKEELIKFKFKKDGISHAKPDIKKFVWRGKQVDLRTISDKKALLIAKDPNCGVLTLTKKGQEMVDGSKSDAE